MLGRRPIAISLLLLSALPFVKVGAINGLDVQWHTTPRVDGAIGDGEYPAFSPVSNCRLYLSQNTSFLFIAVSIPDTTYSANDDVTIWIGSEPPSPNRTARVDDYRVSMSRSGTSSASHELRKLKNATTTDSGGWRVEVAIGFSELDLTAGKSRNIGFALFIKDGGQVVVRWPENADKDSPKTWGNLSSSYSWGTVDLATQSLTLGTQRPIMGENVTLYLSYTNGGSSPIPVPQIGFYVDGVLFAMIDDARIIETSKSYIVIAFWMATAGNHTIRATLDPLNNVHETNENNNEYSVNVYVKPASLTILAQEGVNVTVDGAVSTVGPSKEFTQGVNLGVHTIVAQEMLYYDDTRYVFYKWKWGSEESNDSAMALSVTGDMSVEAFYRTEYLVKLHFLDSKGNNITDPSEVRFAAPNGSSKVLNGTYDVWLQQGTITITNIIWSSVDVRSADTTYQIQGPRTLTLRCNVFNLNVELSDSLSLPVSGANVTLILPNQTKAWLLTDADGKALFAQIPAGSLSGTVSNLGFITPIPEQGLTSDSTIRLSLALSASTIVLIASISTAMVLALLFYMRKRGPRKVKGKPDKLLHSLGPPT